MAFTQLTAANNNGAVDKREPADSDDDSKGYDDFLSFLQADSPSSKKEQANKVSSVAPTPAEIVEVKATVVPKKATYVDAKAVPVAVAEPTTVTKVEPVEVAQPVDVESTPAKPAPVEKAPVVPAPAAVSNDAMEDAESGDKPKDLASPALSTDSEQSLAWSVSQAAALPKTERSDSTNAMAVQQQRSTKQVKVADDASSVAESIAASAMANVNLHPTAPAAVAYFTKKAALEEAENCVSMRKLAVDNMSDAHRYFDKKTTEEAIEHAAKVKELIEAPRPAAVEYFTLMEMEAKAKRDLANRDAVEEPAPAAVEFFTTKARLEKEARDAENKALKENPPPTSTATAYFAKKESQRKIEIANMANEPAPAAVEYFTNKANEERKRQEEAMERSNATVGEASEATKYFEKQASMKADLVKSNRALINSKPYEEPLPVDYFTKLGDKEREEKAKAQWEAAEAVMPAGIAYFTAKAKEDREKALAEHAKGHSEMSVATKYFNKLDADKKAEAARKAKEEPEPMPAAIQKFTLEAYKEHDKKKAEIKALHDNPPEMPEATAYFTNMENERREKQQAENQALRENPPPSSTATAYFAEKEKERKTEIENMMSEPAPAAVEYFTNKANEERKRQEEAMRKSDATVGEKSAATAHFEKQASQKLSQIQSSRELVKNKKPQEALPVDYFTKLGKEETAAKAKSARDLAESVVPEATRYFTSMAEEEKARKLAEFHEGNGTMSVATAHFNRLALEKKEEEARKAKEEPEIMPAAIQKFTLAAYEERQKKLDALERAKDCPAEVPAAVAHFTPSLD